MEILHICKETHKYVKGTANLLKSLYKKDIIMNQNQLSNQLPLPLKSMEQIVAFNNIILKEDKKMAFVSIMIV